MSYYPYTWQGLRLDPYRICRIYGVDDPALAHAVKKILCAGQRGGGKCRRQDIEEGIVCLQRWLEMQDEDMDDVDIVLGAEEVKPQSG